MKIFASGLVTAIAIICAPAKDISYPTRIYLFALDPANSQTSDLHFASFTISKIDLQYILDFYFVISESEWRNGYSHVAGGDRSGTALLSNGSSIHWMARPGGLATVTYKNGITTYLASTKPLIKNTAEQGAAANP